MPRRHISCQWGRESFCRARHKQVLFLEIDIPPVVPYQHLTLTTTMPKRSAKAAKAPPKGGDPDSIELQADDILVGRGFQYEGNPGNAMFQEAIESAVTEYNAAPTRKDKTEVVKRIYHELSQTSRFLRLDAETGRGILCSTKEAKQKISHALRYRSQLESSEDNALLVASSDSKASAVASSATTRTTTDSEALFRKEAAIPSQARSYTQGEPSKRESIIGDAGSNKKRKLDGHYKAASGAIDDDENDEDDDSSMFSGGQLESVLGLPHEYRNVPLSKQQPARAVGRSRQQQQQQLRQQGGLSTSQALSIAANDQQEEAIRIGETELSSLEEDSPPKEAADSAKREFCGIWRKLRFVCALLLN